MTMNRVAVLGLLALCGMQAGCVVDPCASGARRGNLGVLDFGVPQDAAQGLQAKVMLFRSPQTWFEGPFIFTRPLDSCFGLDRDGAEVQVDLPASMGSAPAAVATESTPQRDVAIRFTCGAAPGEPQQVGVRVVAGGRVLHEDSFTISCHQLATASAAPIAEWFRPLSGSGYVVGGVLHVVLELRDAEGRALTGSGAVPADALLAYEGPVFSQTQYGIWIEDYRVLAPGQSPALQIASSLVPLPVTLLPDDAWSLQIDTRPTSSEGVFDFSAWPKTAAGEKLNGLERCRWTAFTATDSEVLSDIMCDMQHSDMLAGGNRFITRVCVEGLGRTGCVPMPN